VDDALRDAVELFNSGRFSEFQEAIEKVSSATRAPSERHFYALLGNLAESLLQLSDGDVADAEGMVTQALRKLDEFLPRFRGLNVEGLRDDFRNVLVELREVRAGRKTEWAPSRLPRLRVLPE
jgi:hypothetical protein